jgi:hypothetical protein
MKKIRKMMMMMMKKKMMMMIIMNPNLIIKEIGDL